MLSSIVLFSVPSKYKGYLVLGEDIGPCKGIGLLGVDIGAGILDLCGLVNCSSSYFSDILF